ncbi:PREDICTED: armadillo repeat-containing X-linked protein 1 isoform X2 [Hipposideros armiger]|uniref:Armadillo repeat-containing X-linked protein 1 isoform X2 n=1 Tax=Hipposideros armiger TaxID=186990 RepID=A0A8B7Q8G9_HIPAR|nr:PREDICTED: armadillo repeat-containing X-linked protein 1 isoform X2 [Hipposideros armiger]
MLDIGGCIPGETPDQEGFEKPLASRAWNQEGHFVWIPALCAGPSTKPEFGGCATLNSEKLLWDSLKCWPVRPAIRLCQVACQCLRILRQKANPTQEQEEEEHYPETRK